MVTLKKDKQSIQEELSELLNLYYDGSFARMVSEYIHATGMTEAEVDALLEEMKHSITFVSWIRFLYILNIIIGIVPNRYFYEIWYDFLWA